MNDPEVFNVFFNCDISEGVKEWLCDYTPEAGYAYGELQTFGSLEFKGPVFVVQFLSKVDEEALRGHFYTPSGQLKA